ncbi:MAG: CotH kinase family protein, partial [Verrucomicrobia bacterium]|nr:CotH kinase family protein [Verrucomicrobiota bacterium]
RMEANDGWQWDGAGGQPQYARDEFGRRSQLALGQPAGHGRNIHLYINGFYWGVYNIVERPDVGFAEAYLDVPKENWDGINTGGAVNGGSTAPWRDLTRLTTAISRGDTEAERTAAFYKVMGRKPDGSNDPALESFIDAENFIDYLLVNWYMGNTDWPGNNYYCGREKGADSEGYKFFMWDAEWTLFIGGSTSTDQTSNTDGVAQPHAGLRNSLEYRMLFADRAHRALFNGGALTEDACAARYDAFVKDHPLILIAESARWGDQHRTSSPRTVADWKREYDRLKSSWFPRRTEIFVTQLRRAKLYPEVDAPTFNQVGGEVAASFQLTMTSPRGTVYYTLDGSDPRLPILGDTSATEQELLPENAPRSFRVPLSADDGFTANGIRWTSPDFVESTDWQTTTGAVGFETNGGGFADLVEFDLQPLMSTKSAALLLRIPFTLTQTQVDDLDFLKLQAKYDDGFVAFINGVEIARANAPANVDGNSTATESHSDASAVVFEDFTASAGLPALRAGTNVLAIIGLNGSRGGSDFYQSVRLSGGRDQTISRSALVYTGPVTLDSSSAVNARSLLGDDWSALMQASFLVGTQRAAAGNLVVSEINFRPPAPSADETEAGHGSRSDFEFIELTNIGTSAVNLSGVTITGGIQFADDVGTTIAPGSSVIVAANREAFLTRYGATPESRIVGTFTGKLDNNGETITVLAAGGATIASLSYSDAAPWPVGDADAGFTIELISPAANPNPDNPTLWRVSTDPFGSPGTIGTTLGFTGNPNADNDADGIPALLEYALGTSDNDPVTGPGNITLVIDPSNRNASLFTFTVNNSAADISRLIESSSQLASWTDATATLLSDTPVADGTTSVRTYRISHSASEALYVRLRVKKE